MPNKGIQKQIDNSHYIKFKGKKIHIGYNPRIGKCSTCGRTDQRTQIHHDQYDESNPMAHTREICMSCHNKIHRRGRKRKLTSISYES